VTLETIRKNATDKADHLITCDHHGCKAALDAMDRSFFQATQFIRAKGWQARKERGTWFHYCTEHRIMNGQKLSK
jgi:hypothetical protein